MATRSPQNQNRNLARREKPQLVGSYRRASDITPRLQNAKKHYHLVAPATSVGTIPEGTAVALSMVEVDPRDMRDGGELYSVGGDSWSIARSALNRIAQAAGISWDPDKSRRLDDGSDPNYVHYRAVGTLRTFDGTELVITGEKEMDLRDGSPQIQSMLARSKSGDITKQLRELRLHILAHAESKAKNRAIRSIGLRASYSREELQKPFVVAKLMWTGQSDDPELRARFAEMTAARMLGGPRAMFSAPPTPAPAAPALKAPPPIGSVEPEPDDEGFYAPPPSGGRTTIDAPPASDSSPTSPSNETWTIPGGREKGAPLHEASEKSLEWWASKIAGDLEQGKTKPQFLEKDRALLAAMREELDRRHGVVPEGEEPGWDGDGDGEGELY